jgi:type IV secretory pathway VirB10-like protein
MGESRAITGLDRLPWLADEKEAPRRSTSNRRLSSIALLILVVAALSYWLGTKSWSLFPPRDAEPRQISDPIPLPEARPLPPPEIAAEPVMEAGPLPAPPVVKPAATPAPPRAAAKRDQRRPKPAVQKPAEKAKKLESSGLRDPWPVRRVDGAAGRLVHVGTFSTRRQAKRGWNALMRVNPSLQRLPAMVVPVESRRNNRTYYRLQMGTTSQAHSVALCQRLRMIGQSCIVLPEAVEKAE